MKWFIMVIIRQLFSNTILIVELAIKQECGGNVIVGKKSLNFCYNRMILCFEFNLVIINLPRIVSS